MFAALLDSYGESARDTRYARYDVRLIKLLPPLRATLRHAFIAATIRL